MSLLTRSPIDLGSSITYLSHPSLQSIFLIHPHLLNFTYSVCAIGLIQFQFFPFPVFLTPQHNTFDPLIARLASLAGRTFYLYQSIKVNGD